MADFIWKYHTQSTKHPESDTVMTLGNSYEFASQYPAPDQREFTLNFPVMKIYTIGNTDPPVIDYDRNVEINVMALYKHWLDHKRWKTFRYPHPIFGWVNVRYAEPFELPEGIAGGNGAVRAFSVKLKEQP